MSPTPTKPSTASIATRVSARTRRRTRRTSRLRSRAAAWRSTARRATTSPSRTRTWTWAAASTCQRRRRCWRCARTSPSGTQNSGNWRRRARLSGCSALSTAKNFRACPRASCRPSRGGSAAPQAIPTVHHAGCGHRHHAEAVYGIGEALPRNGAAPGIFECAIGEAAQGVTCGAGTLPARASQARSFGGLRGPPIG